VNQYDNNGDGKRVWVIDMETFGLNYLDDPVLEIGISIRDLNWNEIDSFHVLVWDSYYDLLLEEHEENKTFVFDMHTKSGLFHDAWERGVTSEEASTKMATWISGHGVNPKEDYLLGSSVHFDATMLHFNFPDIRSQFHHRLIDISSLKVMVEMWFPNLSVRLKEDVSPRKAHRVLLDIEDTVEEARWYMDNVMPEGDEINA